ncbi:MAG: peptidylprolyl isomerase [Cytobacillus gottheilii]
MKNKKWIYVVIGAVLVIGIGAAIFFTPKNLAAKVDGEEISMNELQEQLVSQYGTTALDALITNNIIEQEMKKENIKITQEEIDEEMTVYMDSYGGEDAFNEILATNGIEQSAIEKDIEMYLATKKLIEPAIEITDEEMKEYFDENKDSYGQEEQVEASHILVEDEETANEVVKKLTDGGDFAELAREYSTDEATAESGGELGYFGRGEMAEAFEDVAFSQEAETISEPVKTEFGYHIIKTTGKKEAKEAVFEDVKDEIKTALLDTKMQTEYPAWLDKKYEEYEITNYLQD